MKKPKAWLAWSSGKDSAWALHQTLQDNSHEVCGLLTTITRTFERVAMHAVRETLLTLQAQAAGLPLIPVYIPSPCPDEVYEAAMAKAMAQATADGIETVIFGDLFLQDVRAYREKQLARVNLKPHFPLWNKPTDVLAATMIKEGVEAWITCLDPRKMPSHLAGRCFDQSLLASLPARVDPCGENGEFHTFVSKGPMFRHSIAIEIAETVERDGFIFTDIKPATT